MTMTSFCHAHNRLYQGMQCPQCDNERQQKAKAALRGKSPLTPATAPPHTPKPLTPEAKAVLEAARIWAHEVAESIGRLSKAEVNLLSALSVLDASQKPKDYAPDELEPGTRFRFVENQQRHGALGYCQIIEVDGAHRWHKNAMKAFPFVPGDRLIPLQEPQE